MDKQVADAIAELKAQGIPLAVDPSGSHGDVYIATAPNGEKYKFSAAGLLNLKAKENCISKDYGRPISQRKNTPNLQ